MKNTKVKNLATVFAIIFSFMLLSLVFAGCGENDPGYWRVTVQAEDESQGTVSGSGLYIAGQKFTICAMPEDGYVFNEWSDGNKSAVRTVSVYAETTFVARFKEIPNEPEQPGEPALTTYYALDKVEVYVVEGVSPKSVNINLDTIEISKSGNIVSDLKMFGSYVYLNGGAGLVETDYHSGNYHTGYVSIDSPLSFYSPKNNYNKFVEGEQVELKVSMGVELNDCILNQDNQTYTSSKMTYSAFPDRKAISVTPSSTSKVFTKSIGVIEGYEIMLRLNFVEIE